MLTDVLAGKEELTEFEDSADSDGLKLAQNDQAFYMAHLPASIHPRPSRVFWKSPCIQSPLKITPTEASVTAIQDRLCQFCIE